MKKLLLKFLLVSSLMGISSIGADESNLNIYEDQQSDPFVRYIDVQNLRLYSLDEVSNKFLKNVAKTYLLMLKTNSQIDPEMRAEYLKITKNNYVYQRIGLEGTDYYEKKFNTSFNNLPQSRIVENGPFRENITDYIWEYRRENTKPEQITEVIEHLLHTITNVAFSIQYSDWDWRNPSSMINLATQEAIDKGIFNISGYKEILDRGDEDGFNKAITTEFAYWLIAVEWGLGDFIGIPNDEFRIGNRKEISEKLPLGHRMYKCYVEKILSPPDLKSLLSIFPTNGKTNNQDSTNKIEDYNCDQNINLNQEINLNINENISLNQEINLNIEETCNRQIKGFWEDYLELNKSEFNSRGYLFIVAGEDDRCEYGVGINENDAFIDCTKWKEENNIIGKCMPYAKDGKVLLDKHSNNDEAKQTNNVEAKPTNNIFKSKESKNLSSWECMRGSFDKFVEVFGVYVVGSPRAPMDKVLHTAGVLAQYLDNDEDGQPDDPKITSYLSSNNYIVPVWSSNDRDKFWQSASGSICEDNIGMAASMYYDEDQWAIGGIKKTGQWDTNLEEVWHVVSAGWYEVYPEYFGNNSSKLLDAMNKARGGFFKNIPSKYPKNAWYAYNDETCSYECQAHEYFYWILMANINALDRSYTDKCRPNDEWNVCNKSELKEIDFLAFELLNSYNFILPTQIPDGKYKANAINIY